MYNPNLLAFEALAWCVSLQQLQLLPFPPCSPTTFIIDLGFQARVQILALHLLNLHEILGILLNSLLLDSTSVRWTSIVTLERLLLAVGSTRQGA